MRVDKSFCTLKKVLHELDNLALTGANIIPIMSETAYNTDTRFGTSEYFAETLKSKCGNDIIKTVKEAEPIGPKKLLDLLIIAPCTGNTLAKIANGIADSAVLT